MKFELSPVLVPRRSPEMGMYAITKICDYFSVPMTFQTKFTALAIVRNSDESL
jgi:hypothetical protein